jgi:hypothetical protein
MTPLSSSEGSGASGSAFRQPAPVDADARCLLAHPALAKGRRCCALQRRTNPGSGVI